MLYKIPPIVCSSCYACCVYMCVELRNAKVYSDSGDLCWAIWKILIFPQLRVQLACCCVARPESENFNVVWLIFKKLFWCWFMQSLAGSWKCIIDRQKTHLNFFPPHTSDMCSRVRAGWMPLPSSEREREKRASKRKKSKHTKNIQTFAEPAKKIHVLGENTARLTSTVCAALRSMKTVSRAREKKFSHI